MANKEGKFFEQLGMLAENAYEAGEVFQRITEGKMEIEDGVDAIHAIKKEHARLWGNCMNACTKYTRNRRKSNLPAGLSGRCTALLM